MRTKRIISFILIAVMILGLVPYQKTAYAVSNPWPTYSTYMYISEKDGADVVWPRASVGLNSWSIKSSGSVVYAQPNARIYGSIASGNNHTISTFDRMTYKQIVGSGGSIRPTAYYYGGPMFTFKWYYLQINAQPGDIFEARWAGSYSTNDAVKVNYAGCTNYIVIGSPSDFNISITGLDRYVDFTGKIDRDKTKSLQLKANYSKAWASKEKNEYWSTSDSRVATVDNSGKVTINGSGNVKLTVKASLKNLPEISSTDYVNMTIYSGANPSINGIQAYDYRTEYTKNSSFSEQGDIMISYENGTSKRVPLTENMVSGFSTSTVGNKTATVTYQGNMLWSSFFVTVVANKIRFILPLHTLPQTVSYICYKSAGGCDCRSHMQILQ